LAELQYEPRTGGKVWPAVSAALFLVGLGLIGILGMLLRADKPLPYLWCNECDNELLETGWCQTCRTRRPY